MGVRLGRLYFAAQALAVSGWWLLLALRPDLRAWFRLPDTPDATLLAFAPGDLLLAVLGSALVAFSRASRAWVRPLAWAVAGAMAYAALYTLTLAYGTAMGPLGALLMIPAAIGSGLAARALDHVGPGLSPGAAR